MGCWIGYEWADAELVRGTQMEIACEYWFTAAGNTKPLIIKFKDEVGEI